MSDYLWSFDQLARLTRYEDPEVRFWAAERMASLYPEEAADPIAELILDDHDATPELAAEHLGTHGQPRHVPALLKGFRKGSGRTPGLCIQALARIGFEGTPEMARTALHEKDVPESCLGIMVSALAEMATGGHAPAADGAREFLLRRPELFAEPAALRGAIALYAPGDFRELVLKWITALHFKGADQVDACIRILIEELQLEDCGWCVRTDRTGRIDIERTIKAIESGYDVDLREAIGSEARAELARLLEGGSFPEIAGWLGGYVRRRAEAIAAPEPDPLPRRLAGLGRAFETRSILQMAERLEPSAHQWLIGTLIAAAIKVTLYRNYLLDLERVREDLDGLLALAAAETSCLLNVLPRRIAALAGPGQGARRAAAIDWCLRTLEARGPFFPKAVALETLGELRAVDLVPEIATHLSDDNAYIYSAAERSLSRLGGAVIEHTRAALGRGGVHPEALQSLARLVCEMGREASLRLVIEHFDEILETIGPEAAAEAASLLGHQDLIPHLRRWLSRSPAMVGHALLVIGGIHNLPIPEEESILKAIDDYWKRADESEGTSGPSGQYLM